MFVFLPNDGSEQWPSLATASILDDGDHIGVGILQGIEHVMKLEVWVVRVVVRAVREVGE